MNSTGRCGTKIVRYHTNHGWHHAIELKRGYRWVVVRDLCLTREKDGTLRYRTRKVSIEIVAEALWALRGNQ